MDLRHLRYFVTLAEELHFSRAARRLNISQPPLSQQIKELELELGVKLLERTRRSVALTNSGRVFLAKARRLLADTAELIEVTRQAERGEVGRVAVGFIHSAGYGLLPPIVRAFRAACPGVQMSLQEIAATEQTSLLERGAIDIAIARPGSLGAFARTEFLLSENLVLAMPANHRLRGTGRPDLRIFENETFISFPRSRAPALYENIMRLCTGAGFVPRIGQETDTVHTALGLVGAGVGVAVLPASAMEIGTRSVVFRMPLQTEPAAVTIIGWGATDTSPVVARFVSIAREVAAQYHREQRDALARLERA